MDKIKTQVVFPKEMLKELDKVVTPGKRSHFVVQATRKELQRIRIAHTMEKAAGAWKDDDYPEFKTLNNVHNWLSNIQKEDFKRLVKTAHE
ncbi:MAG: hypothetical protein ACUZ8H_03990 [Candidatus Anammoxibacter sp.]